MLNRRKFLASAAAASLVSPDKADAILHGAPSMQIFNVPFPGGGYSCGMDMHADGTMLSIVDIFGGYVGTTIPGSPWTQIADATKLPSAYSTPPTPFLHGGTYGGAIAPTNSNIMYVILEGNIITAALSTLIKTTNKGVSWTATGAPFVNINAFTGTRNTQGQRVCVDPNNANVVWFGDGTTHTYVSLDGGTTFTQVDGGAGGLPAATGGPNSNGDPGATAMCFDPTSGTTQLSAGPGVLAGFGTRRMLIGITGHGVYVSNNAYLGATSTWTLVTGSPTNPGFGKMASDGNYYVNDVSQGTTLYRISPQNVVTTFTLANGITAFCIDPNNPSRGVSDWNSGLQIGGPMNGAAAFTSMNFAFAIPSTTQEPWFHNAHAGGGGDTGPKSTGNMFFDPLVSTATDTVTIGTGSKTWMTVPAGLNIAVGDTLRVSATGSINTNWMLGTVTAYAAGNLTISVLGSNPGGYLGTATGGGGTFSAWTITKERMWLATGTGMFYTDNITSTGTVNWVPSSWGIEDMVGRHIVWPPGGNPLCNTSDRAIWPILNNPVGATVGQNIYVPITNVELIEGTGLDWASSNPSIIGSVGNSFTGISQNNGISGSWVAFPNAPTGGNQSNIALWDANTMVAYTISGIFYTTNGGASAWTAVPSLPTSGYEGSATHLNGGTDPNPRCIAVERTNTFPKRFYVFSQTNSTFWVVDLSSGSAVVTQKHVGSLSNGGTNQYLRLANPPNIGSLNTAGHLFFSTGLNDSAVASYSSLSVVCNTVPSGYPFSFSTDQGNTWTSAPNVQCCVFGFGAPKPGGNGYPSVYIAGWVSGVYGIYRCDNWDQFPSLVWNNVGTLARNWMDRPTCIEGDPNQWGRFIIGHYGTSFAIGQVGFPPWP